MRKPKRRRLLGKSIYRWENNIKIGSKAIGWDSIKWIHLAGRTD
jgi:hypothetical protein